MTAPDDKGPSEEEEFHHELDLLFSQTPDWFINWMQSKGWRDMQIQLPEMAEWHQQMIENAQVHVYEMDAALHRAKLNFKTAHKNLEDAKKKKEMF